ncbi:unconventional myosin-X-like [Salvelinus sp. IW2-2015]|uniref:unconventional myosin-X-like n=1 Tax=Salvelinus sp. IW2-2015 TaxID=2691554 RepID=UPI0038D3F104
MRAKSLKLKKRWFVLTSNSLDYYKSSERSVSKLGTLVLNSLCSVVQPDEKVYKDTGYWSIVVHGRKHSYHLYTKLLNEAMRWASAIQGVWMGSVAAQAIQVLQRMFDRGSSLGSLVGPLKDIQKCVRSHSCAVLLCA